MRVKQGLPCARLDNIHTPYVKITVIFFCAVALVSFLAYLLYPYLHVLFKLSHRLEVSMVIISASVVIFSVAAMITKKHLKHVFKIISIHNQCATQHLFIRNHYKQTVEDIPDYTNLLCNQLSEAVAQTEEDVLNVVDRLVNIHNESKSQMERIGSSTDKSNELISTMQQQVKQNEEIIRVLDNFSRVQSAHLEDNLKRIQQLSDDIKQLSPLVNIITEIADQTNLLALNAAIEAARAGEAGKGFAVVADEVRKLSNKTNEAAKDIADRISKVTERVQSEIKNAFQVLERNRKTNEFRRLSDSLREIESRFGDTASILEEVIRGIDEANRVIMDEVSAVLGEIQFQDVLRQRIEHVINALQLMNNLAGETLSWLSGDSDAVPEPLKSHMDEIREKYVMYEQRVVHSRVTGDPLSIQDESGPKIELF